MKATELVSSNYFKGLIYGESGAGKTCFAASFPGPIEYWDFDHKASSFVRYMEGDARLNDIDVYQFSQLDPNKRIPAWEVRANFVQGLKSKGAPLPFKTLVLDSITTFSMMIMDDYIVRSQTGIKRAIQGINALQDYQLFEKHMSQIITGLLSLECNVVMLAHVSTEKDESTGQIMRQPLIPGKALGPKLPMWFEEVYVARVLQDGKRVLQTQAKGGFVARCQRRLAVEVPMDVREVLK